MADSRNSLTDKIRSVTIANNSVSRKIFGREIPDNLEPIVITLDNSGDNGNVVFDKDDITDDVLDKLGDHASNITKNASNDPPIKPGSEEISQRTPRGNPVPLDGGSSAESNFIDRLNPDAVTAFEQSSNSRIFPFRIKKGKRDDRTDQYKDGVEILEEVNTLGNRSRVAQAIKEIQEENNRYACEAEYIDPNQAVEEDDSNVGHVILQPILGEHAPRKFPSVAGDGSDVQFKVKRLKNLGLQMLLEASGEYFVPDDTDNFASVVAAKATSTAPGLARLGLRVPVSRFSAAEIAQEVNPNFRKDSKFPRIKAPPHFSHGSVNNPLVPFDAVSSTSSGAAAILLTTTLSFLIKNLANAIGPRNTPIGSKNDKENAEENAEDVLGARKKRLGSYLGQNDDDPQRENSIIPASGFFSAFSNNFFMLQQTENDYSECVKKGSEIFFGKQSLLGALGAVVGLGGQDFKPVSENPGYFNVLLRMLVKSTTEEVGGVLNSVVGTVAAVGGTDNFLTQTGVTGPLDINRNIGLSEDPTNILNAINSLRDTKIINFMDILAVIGDIYLQAEKAEDRDSTIDSIKDEPPDGGNKDFPNPAALHQKNRLRSDGWRGRLAWGSNTLRSMYLLPNSLKTAERLFTGKQVGTTELESIPTFKKNDKNRFTYDDVRDIEKELDACYMPFYFHDLRTNEIISFHAFIETVSDSFTADYNETEGHGRIGKIYTYKNTNRNISVSFKVVATNPSDFSEMWYKINRLIMCLYPQYTAGRVVKFNEQQFIQPFSQLISNSPLIRLRLGDLLKTNYSDFDLARLFGIGAEQFEIGDKVDPTTVSQNYLNEKKKYAEYNFSEGDAFWLINPSTAVGVRKGKINVLTDEEGNPVPFVSEIKLTVVENVEGKKYKVVNDAGDKLVVDFIGQPEGTLAVPDNQKVYDDAGVSGGERDTAIEDFFKENPIVKAFESVAGEGLAGFIKSIRMNWDEARWETTGLNNRAPMLCRIDIEFAPVHDINPGLDSSGAMIGAPYNVGHLLQLMKIKKNKDEDFASDKNKNNKTINQTKPKLKSSKEDTGLLDGIGL